jgi:hypothetical protein
VDYRDWRDRERGLPASEYAQPGSSDEPRDPAERTGRSEETGGFRVPGQRGRHADETLARSYRPAIDAGWSPSGGRRRQLPAQGGGQHSGSTQPAGWHAEDRWRPTLESTDWRYATGELGYPAGYPPWEDEPERDAVRRDQHDDPGTGRVGRRALGAGDWAGDADTEQWERPREGYRPPEEWNSGGNSPRKPLTDTGSWDGATDTGEWRAGDRAEGFWAGLRLSGDDPRWMATPSSAPRSPAVSLPVPIPSDDAAVARSIPSSLPVAPGDGAPADDGPGSVWAAMLATVAWYVVPALVLLAWIVSLDGTAPVDCAADAAQRCESARAQATVAVLDSGPRVSAALGASAVIAILLRWLSSWRASAVGLAAAVIGGGLSTLIISVVTGQPVG